MKGGQQGFLLLPDEQPWFGIRLHSPQIRHFDENAVLCSVNPVVVVVLQLPITCIGNLTPVQHMELHDLMLRSGFCFVNYVRPP